VRLLSSARNIELEYNIIVDPVDTGYDFLYLNGTANDWLPTGLAFAMSELPTWPTGPDVNDNWTWFSDPGANGNALLHYGLLCDYG